MRFNKRPRFKVQRFTVHGSRLKTMVSLRSVFLIKLKRLRRTLIQRWTFDVRSTGGGQVLARHRRVGRSFFNPVFVTRSAGACAAYWILEFEVYL